MPITFEPLHESHFPLLLKWLQAPHVKKWWDRDVIYTMDLVREKYSPYTKGYKLENGVQKPIHGFIIHNNQTPIGYIQLYNAYDFLKITQLFGLPESLGAIDIFIGEENCLHKGIGSDAIKQFLKQYALSKYRYIIAIAEYRNEIAVRAYKKAGFVILKNMDDEFLMAAYKKMVRLSIQDSIALEYCFKRNFLANDRLWVFGSRADLAKKGGDIDLYVETCEESVDVAAKMKSKFLSELEEMIGEQKIDLVLNMINSPYPLPIYEVALTEGVRII